MADPDALSQHEDGVRAALASRVAEARPAADEAIPDAEGALRSALSATVEQLLRLRSERTEIADRIRELVYQEEILRRAVRVFERAEARET